MSSEAASVAPTPRLGARAAGGAFVTMAGQGVRVAVQFGGIILLARLLTPHDYGLMAMVTAIVGAAEILRDFGLSSAAVQAREVSRAQRDNLFWINTGIGLLLAVAVFAGANALAAFCREPALVQISRSVGGHLPAQRHDHPVPRPSQPRSAFRPTRPQRRRRAGGRPVGGGGCRAGRRWLLGAGAAAGGAGGGTAGAYRAVRALVAARLYPRRADAAVPGVRLEPDAGAVARLRQPQCRPGDHRCAHRCRSVGPVQPRLPIADDAAEPDQRPGHHRGAAGAVAIAGRPRALRRLPAARANGDGPPDRRHLCLRLCPGRCR